MSEILDLTGALSRERERQESRRCRCNERKAAGQPGKCAACRVATFKRMSADADEPGTWSSDISAPVGVRRADR